MIEVTKRKKGNFLKKSVAEGKENDSLNRTLRSAFESKAGDQAIENWFSTKEAAIYLGLSSNALRLLVHRGKVRAYKLGARLKFKEKDLQATIKPKREVV